MPKSSESSIVLDTSAVLNLLGSGRPRMMLSASQLRPIVPEAVLREVQREPALETPSDASLRTLIEDKIIAVASETDASLALAIELAGAEIPNDLGDGEAFAIALAVTRRLPIVLDERKARRITFERFSDLKVLFTLEYIEEIAMSAELSEAAKSDVIFSALRYARMRVPRNRFKDISELVGDDRAKECSSLGFVQLEVLTSV
jgi:predicted nucleic acid-binding protein